MRRLAALAAVPLVLAAALMGLDGGPASAQPQRTQPTSGQICILIIICFGSSSPSPTSSPSPSSPAAASSPSPGSDPVATPSAAPSTSPAAAPTATPNPSASASDSPAPGAASGSASPSGSPSPQGGQSPSDSASPSPSATPANGSVSGGFVASDATWAMTVSSATMNGFTYQGNVNMPVAGGGTVEMMEFTASSVDFSSVETSVTEDGNTATETDGSFTGSSVTLYATQLSGSVLGIPLTFTPSTALTNVLTLTKLIPGGLPTITMTGVTADQTIIIAGQVQRNGLAAEA